MKRFVAILMAVLMIAVAGCSGDGNSSSADNSAAGNSTASDNSTASGDSAASEDDSLFNAPGELPIVKEGTMTLSVFAPGNGEYSWEDNDQTAVVEEKTGVHIDWQIAASSDNVRDKISTMFAGG